jgi:hypothetical protein
MDDRWIIIPNWERFQHYGDRAPVWIKVYLELNDRDDWRRLSFAQRGLVVSLWCEYGAANGLLRTSDVPGRVAQKVLNRTWDLLQREGWIALSASKPAALRASTARARARVEKDLEIEPPLPPADAGGDNPPTDKKPKTKKTQRTPPPPPCPHCGVGAGLHTDDCTREAEAQTPRRTSSVPSAQERHAIAEQLRASFGTIQIEEPATGNGEVPADQLPWEGEEPPIVT